MMESRLTEEQKRKLEAYGLIHLYKLRAMRASIVYWFLVVVAGIVGTIFWSWFAVPVAIVAAIVWGSVVSHTTAKMIERRTGFSAIEQWEILRNPNFLDSVAEEMWRDNQDRILKEIKEKNGI
jgi:fatty acid desaturase